ncbi:hypothetical protein C1J03_19165 [Sulfitobacter sp. SK012]|uniref:hypothetical protein n=1 Tax=Sulfitobacter sp. SK012 TaxID=1389005 RepID=UPI000E0C1B3F|nr:hypothetical protein [Sulfitobacter sp. SK012]AXI47938.1 hypothetical protein C1J03_19165 [Sulfitobacter sp. SK012]
MKTHVNAVGTPNLWPQLQRSILRVASVCKGYASKVYSGFANFVTNLQIGRMESVLRKMSDQELAQIGITQSEIKRHARFLVTYESDRT